MSRWITIVLCLLFGVVLLWVLRIVFVKVRRIVLGRYFSWKSPPFQLENNPNNVIGLPTTFPKRGETFYRSFAIPSPNELNNKQSLRIVTLNMEMGRQLDKVIEQMQQLDPDIILLQEVDVGVRRTRRLDTAGQIASALHMHYVFTCEIEDPERSQTQYLKKKKNKTNSDQAINGGCEGNAILSKYEFESFRPLVVQCRQQLPPHKSHSRFKTHCEAVGVVKTPFGRVHCYSIHLDPNNTGIKGRIAQYLDILEDVNKNVTIDSQNHVVIGGDFNTMVNGIARFNPILAPDWFSIAGTLGWTEAEYFQRHAVEYGNELHSIHLYDAFDKSSGTFPILKHNSKLDWILLSDTLYTRHKEVGLKKRQRCSDHCWVCVDVAPTTNY